IQQERVADLGYGSDDIHALTGARNGPKIGRRRNIEIPDVMSDFLEVPKASAGPGVDGNEAVRKQVIPEMADADEIVLRRSRRDIGDTTSFIHGHTAPAVCSVRLRSVPRVVAKLARLGDSVKGPEKFPAHDVQSPHVFLKAGHDDDPLE